LFDKVHFQLKDLEVNELTLDNISDSKRPSRLGMYPATALEITHEEKRSKRVQQAPIP